MSKFGVRDAAVRLAQALKTAEPGATDSERELRLAIFDFAYRRGQWDAKKKDARNATNGRMLMGETTRQKVMEQAQPFRHLSKGAAAPLIAALVNKDAGTVRRYLTIIYPGDSWKK